MTNPFNPLAYIGVKLELIPDSRLPSPITWEQVKFPRTKRKRIRKKWSKRKSNWEHVTREPQLTWYHPRGIAAGLYIAGHPAALDILRERLDK